MIRTVVALAMCGVGARGDDGAEEESGRETRTRGRWMEIVGTRRGDDRDDVRGEKGDVRERGWGGV